MKKQKTVYYIINYYYYYLWPFCLHTVLYLYLHRLYIPKIHAEIIFAIIMIMLIKIDLRTRYKQRFNWTFGL